MGAKVKNYGELAKFLLAFLIYNELEVVRSYYINWLCT